MLELLIPIKSSKKLVIKRSRINMEIIILIFRKKRLSGVKKVWRKLYIVFRLLNKINKKIYNTIKIERYSLFFKDNKLKSLPLTNNCQEY